MNRNRIFLMASALFLILGNLDAFAQNAPQILPTPDGSVKLSSLIAANIAKHEDSNATVSQDDRAKAYSKLLEGQRYIWALTYSRASDGVDSQSKAAKARIALFEATELNPELSEAVTALSELAITGPTGDLEEAIRLAELSIAVDKKNYGAHKILARLYTYKSGLSTGVPNAEFEKKAIDEWMRITELDSTNSEAWAFLSEFYRRTDRGPERLAALQKWVAAVPPLDTGFYQRMMGGREDLSAETASLKLADAYMDAGRFREAIEVLSIVVADKPQNSTAITMLTEAIQRGKAADGASAILALQQAVYANPSNVALVSLLADVSDRTAGVEAGVKVFESAIERATGGRADLDLALGDFFEERGLTDRAVAAYYKAIKDLGLQTGAAVSSGDAIFLRSAYERLIKSLRRAGKTEEGRKAIERARTVLGQKDTFADRQLVTLERYSGNRTGALILVKKMLIRSPKDVGLIRLEASILTYLGRVDEAVEAFQKRSDAAPLGAPITGERSGDGSTSVSVEIPRKDLFSDLMFISQLYTEAGRGKEAIEAAQKALGAAKGTDRRTLARISIATAQQMNKDFAGAESTLRALLTESPANPIALNNLGYFLLERGERFEEALDFIEKALEIDPRNPSYLDSLGWAYLKLGRLSEVEKPLLQALRFAPESSTIHDHIGDYYQRIGRADLAKQHWQKALGFAVEKEEVEKLKQKLAGR